MNHHCFALGQVLQELRDTACHSVCRFSLGCLHVSDRPVDPAQPRLRHRVRKRGDAIDRKFLILDQADKRCAAMGTDGGQISGKIALPITSSAIASGSSRAMDHPNPATIGKGHKVNLQWPVHINGGRFWRVVGEGIRTHAVVFADAEETGKKRPFLVAMVGGIADKRGLWSRLTRPPAEALKARPNHDA